MSQVLKRERLSIDVTPEERKKIKAYAAIEGKSIRDFVLEAVREKLYLEEEVKFLDLLTQTPGQVMAELWDNEKDSAYDEL